MEYKNIKQLIRDLKNGEIEVEDLIIHARKDKKADKEIVKRIKECEIISEKHFNEEVCLSCGLSYEDCPLKNIIKKEIRSKNVSV